MVKASNKKGSRFLVLKQNQEETSIDEESIDDRQI